VKRAWPVLRITLVVALVAVTAYGGISDGLDTVREATTRGQAIGAASQLAYGPLSLVVLLAMAFRPRWVTPLLAAWGLALTVTGTLAPVVWGEAGWGAGAAGGVATALVAALVIAGWRAHLRWGGATPA
jgi:hypothetical protein